MEGRKVFKKNTDMVTRVIDDETILLPIFRASKDLNCIYTLNKVASWVWEMIDGKRTLAEIKKHALKKFDTTPKEADKKMQAFLKELKEIKAIE
jgi:methyltransferase-like protein